MSTHLLVTKIMLRLVGCCSYSISTFGHLIIEWCVLICVQLHPDEKYVHCSCIMFSEGGEYEIQVKCRPTTKCSEGPGRQPSFHAAVLQLTVSEPPDQQSTAKCYNLFIYFGIRKIK